MGFFNFRVNRSIGIDLGIVNILVYSKKYKKIVLNEFFVVVVEREIKRVLVVGNEVKEMFGKIFDIIVVVRFLSEGVIVDYDIIEVMIKYFIKKIFGLYSFFMLEIMICVFIDVIGVEKRVVLEVVILVGVKKVYLIEEVRVVVLGLGMDIVVFEGNMIIDIGGGFIDVVIIFFGGIVVSKIIRVVGNNFDFDIIKYVKKIYNFLIGDRIVEEIKMKIGIVFLLEEEEIMEVKGRDLLMGLFKVVIIIFEEVREVIKDFLD